MVAARAVNDVYADADGIFHVRDDAGRGDHFDGSASRAGNAQRDRAAGPVVDGDAVLAEAGGDAAGLQCKLISVVVLPFDVVIAVVDRQGDGLLLWAAAVNGHGGGGGGHIRADDHFPIVVVAVVVVGDHADGLRAGIIGQRARIPFGKQQVGWICPARGCLVAVEIRLVVGVCKGVELDVADFGAVDGELHAVGGEAVAAFLVTGFGNDVGCAGNARGICAQQTIGAQVRVGHDGGGRVIPGHISQGIVIGGVVTGENVEMQMALRRTDCVHAANDRTLVNVRAARQCRTVVHVQIAAF